MAKMIQVPYKTKKYFTNDDSAHLIYFQFPKLLMYGGKYKGMSSDGKLFYMLCLDLIKLSMKKGWRDEYGRYYIKMSLDTIQERMNCAKPKAVNLKKELVQYELMDVVRLGQGKADRLYILQLDYTNEDIYKANNDHEDIENDEFLNYENQRTLQPQEKSQNLTSSSNENELLEVTKSAPIKNNSIKTNQLRTKNSEIPQSSLSSGIDDDKRASSTPLTEEEELIISIMHEETKDELVKRSFNAVVRKVVDKYKQGKVNSFRDYLVTALVNKIEELELRRMKDQAKPEEAKDYAESKRIQLDEIDPWDYKNRQKIFPMYNWLED